MLDIDIDIDIETEFLTVRQTQPDNHFCCVWSILGQRVPIQRDALSALRYPYSFQWRSDFRSQDRKL